MDWGLPSRLSIKLPTNFEEDVQRAQNTYCRFGRYSRSLDQIRLCLEHKAIERKNPPPRFCWLANASSDSSLGSRQRAEGRDQARIEASVEHRGINLCPHRTHNCAAAGEIVGTTVLAQRPEYVGQRTSRCYGNALQLVQFWLGGKFDTRKIETSSRMRRWCLSSIMLQAVWVA